jgi:hypothetical protein
VRKGEIRMVAEVMPEQTEQTKQPVFKVERAKLAEALVQYMRATDESERRCADDTRTSHHAALSAGAGKA